MLDMTLNAPSRMPGIRSSVSFLMATVITDPASSHGYRRRSIRAGLREILDSVSNSTPYPPGIRPSSKMPLKTSPLLLLRRVHE